VGLAGLVLGLAGLQTGWSTAMAKGGQARPPPNERGVATHSHGENRNSLSIFKSFHDL
jgi:hypothetical protein